MEILQIALIALLITTWFFPPDLGTLHITRDEIAGWSWWYEPPKK